jgi:hypothetical protein
VDRVQVVADIMRAFGARTGLTTDVSPRRYLWTDAFAVCSLLGLRRATGATAWLQLARSLVDQVHRVLGRHRGDDVHTGWISGLDEDEGRRRPTAGGLRIGKPLPERRSAEPAHDRVDWDRDGQYYHYLTRWMHALERAAAETGDASVLRHGVELAQVAHAAFAHDAPGGKRLYWKMSVDLSRPVVDTMGQHDPLDGLAVTSALAARTGAMNRSAPLGGELADLAAMCEGRGWATADALGIGGLLVDALQLARLVGIVDHVDGRLVVRALRDAGRSLDLVTVGSYLDGPAGDRLAFRELGLAIGLAAVGRLDALARTGRLPGGADAALDRLRRHVPLRERIESFWLEPAHQAAQSWTAHEDINAVMLATSLLPDAYLG